MLLMQAPFRIHRLSSAISMFRILEGAFVPFDDGTIFFGPRPYGRKGPPSFAAHPRNLCVLTPPNEAGVPKAVPGYTKHDSNRVGRQIVDAKVWLRALTVAVETIGLPKEAMLN